MHAGSTYQNVGLYVASAEMHNLVRWMIDHEKAAKDLALPKEKRLVVSQSIGWEK